MDIRQLRYLIALAREQHFSRAADACAVTQPTLSARIRQLEDDLGVQIVLRGQRYHGLTAEGERVLRWARRIVEDFDRMRSEITLEPGNLEGVLTLGVIPSALPLVPGLALALRERHPRLRLAVLSRSSNEILRQLEDFSIDAGITYIANEPLERGILRPLFAERYRLVVRADHPLAGRAEIGWAEAAAEPLCLLTADMQNRRIIDAAFRAARCRPSPEVESNSVTNLCAFVATGQFASVLPECLLPLLGGGERFAGIALVAPVVEHEVGLVALERTPLPAPVAALVEAAERARAPGRPGR